MLALQFALTYLHGMYDQHHDLDEDREAGFVENVVFISLMCAGAIVVVGLIIGIAKGMANSTGAGVPGGGK
jgi:hypothetical protein